MFAKWDELLYGAEDTTPSDVLLGELLLYYFEWFAAKKESKASAQAVHGLLSMLLPKDNNVPGWAHLKNLLEKVHADNVQAVHLCPNDHIAFIDCTHPKLKHYKHSHRQFCPHPGCGAARYVTNESGQQVPAKVGYYFPIDPFLRDIFKDPDLQEHLHQDVGEYPPGHTRHSKGPKHYVHKCLSCAHHVHIHARVCTYCIHQHHYVHLRRLCAHCVHIQSCMCTYCIHQIHYVHFRRLCAHHVHIHASLCT
jgi:hypothetical protein